MYQLAMCMSIVSCEHAAKHGDRSTVNIAPDNILVQCAGNGKHWERVTTHVKLVERMVEKVKSSNTALNTTRIAVHTDKQIHLRIPV